MYVLFIYLIHYCNTSDLVCVNFVYFPHIHYKRNHVLLINWMINNFFLVPSLHKNTKNYRSWGWPGGKSGAC